MVVDAEVERLVLSTASDADLECAARSRGMATLYETGMAKVWGGITTIEEVLSVTRVN
jgi:type II secretory ATPase GspE/PulE/Tfp pilus assembly ATPase PilB-like protein